MLDEATGTALWTSSMPPDLPELSNGTFDAILALALQPAPPVAAPIAPTTKAMQSAFSSPPGEIHVTVWDEVAQRRVSGPAAPTEDRLARFLDDNPSFSVYAGQTARPALVRRALLGDGRLPADQDPAPQEEGQCSAAEQPGRRCREPAVCTPSRAAAQAHRRAASDADCCRADRAFESGSAESRVSLVREIATTADCMAATPAASGSPPKRARAF